jgi:hypothetical protein
MHGITEQTDWDIDYDRDGLPEARWPVLTFFAGTLECNACGLVLDGSEEIKAAALETSWMNDWIDLETWMQENVYDDAY